MIWDTRDGLESRKALPLRMHHLCTLAGLWPLELPWLLLVFCQLFHGLQHIGSPCLLLFVWGYSLVLCLICFLCAGFFWTEIWLIFGDLSLPPPIILIYSVCWYIVFKWSVFSVVLVSFCAASYLEVVMSRDDRVPTKGDFLAALLPLMCIPALLSLCSGLHKWWVDSIHLQIAWLCSPQPTVFWCQASKYWLLPV